MDSKNIDEAMIAEGVTEKLDKLNKSVCNILPNYGRFSFFGFTKPGKQIQNATIDTIVSNKKYYGSDYCYDKGNLLIHYTNIEVMLEILKSRKIRLFNLDGMNDTKELFYSRKLVTGKDAEFKEREMRKNHFSFSLCEYENKESLQLWKEYGNSGKGCGIVFEIDNNSIQYWQNFHISKIYYEEEKLKRLQEVYIEYMNMQQNPSRTSVTGFEEVIFSLYSFHKSSIFSYEKEVRLLYVNRDWPTTFNEHNFPYFRNGKRTSFIELDMDNQRNIKPIVKIKKIIFGYDVSNTDKHNISRVISEYIRDKDEPIDVENSLLTSHFQ